jgi:hypothetical protein
MNAFATYFVAEHLLDLRREAEREALVREAQTTTPSTPDRGAGLGRWLGRSARALSVALDGVASRVDPVETPRASARTSRERVAA